MYLKFVFTHRSAFSLPVTTRLHAKQLLINTDVQKERQFCDDFNSSTKRRPINKTTAAVLVVLAHPNFITSEFIIVAVLSRFWTSLDINYMPFNQMHFEFFHAYLHSVLDTKRFEVSQLMV